ncbi:MAG: PAS domain-containing sensor histidine kinase [Deltaproteobacteria bacterium]|nr:PAS domain-containing sensor histidine kinase [Myxococcales bacterium]MDP3215405.1 PAS domain-containing sensor histidine kinase [Deltaproteobacteria bacterium]
MDDDPTTGGASEQEGLAIARDALRAAAAARDLLLAQVREANEKLLLAALRAQDAADAADAARVAIEESEERFRSLVTTAAAVVWHASADGRVRVEPESWWRFTGTTPRESADYPAWGWLDNLHPSDRERVRSAWNDSVAASSAYATDHRLRRGDGSYAWVASRAVPIPSTGPTREWIGTMTDVSDRVRMETARDQFIGILGHDLRSPLSAVKMAAHLLEHGGPGQRTAELAARISRSSRRMEAMIESLLLFARARLGGGIPITRRACTLGRLCADQVAEAREAHPGRAIGCATSGDLDGEWDPDRLEQVLSNLITNAVAHGEDPISVAVHGEGDLVTLTVQNHGPPIRQSLLPTLFEPYHGDERSKGLGLGLYIVCEIVRAHGGVITVRSEAGEGTLFTVALPRRAPDQGPGAG